MGSRTYRDIAKDSGVDVAQVWRVLCGKSNPTYSTARSLAQALGVSLDDFVGMLGIKWDAVHAYKRTSG
jgi:transcriptional regulator with XRE-family HTH domain